MVCSKWVLVMLRKWVGNVITLSFVIAAGYFLAVIPPRHSESEAKSATAASPFVSAGWWSEDSQQRVKDFVAVRQSYSWRDTVQVRQEAVRPYVTEKYLNTVDLSLDSSNADMAFVQKKCHQRMLSVELTQGTQFSFAAVAYAGLELDCRSVPDQIVDIVYIMQWVNVNGEWRVDSEEFVSADEE